MPLSEHEQQILKQLEQGYFRDDPNSAKKLESTNLAGYLRRRFRFGALGVIVGALLVLSVLFTNWIVAAVGFLLMTLGGVLVVDALRRIGLDHLSELRGPGSGFPLGEDLRRTSGRLFSRLKRSWPGRGRSAA